MKKKTPSISVIMPVWNGEKYLPRCLDSLLAQAFTDWEIICINDGSRDNSAEILKKYAARDKRFKIITKKKNMGVSAARNDGLAMAGGKYIHCFDADDFIDADCYEKMFAAAQENNADMACCGFVSNSKYTHGIKYKKSVVLTGIYEKLKKTNLLLDSYLWRCLIKRDLISKNKLLFNTELIAQEDTLFILEVARLAKSIVIVPDTQYH